MKIYLILGLIMFSAIVIPIDKTEKTNKHAGIVIPLSDTLNLNLTFPYLFGENKYIDFNETALNESIDNRILLTEYDITTNESYINETIDNRVSLTVYDITTNESYINETIDNRHINNTYLNGTGLNLTENVFSINFDGIKNEHLLYNTGQDLTTESDVTFGVVRTDNETGLIETPLLQNSGVIAIDSQGDISLNTNDKGYINLYNSGYVMGDLNTTNLVYSPTIETDTITNDDDIILIPDGNILNSPDGIINNTKYTYATSTYLFNPFGTTQLSIDQTGTIRDSLIFYRLDGVAKYYAGIDNSNSDKYEIYDYTQGGEIFSYNPISGDIILSSLDTGDITFNSGSTINLKASADTDDYLQITTVANIPDIGAVGDVYVQFSDHIIPDSDNTRNIGTSAKAWKNIYYEGSITDTNPDAIEKELKAKDKKPLDYHLTRKDETLNIEYSPEAVFNKINGSVTMDVGEAGVLSLLQISQLKEELCLYKKYSWCDDSGNVNLIDPENTIITQTTTTTIFNDPASSTYEV